MESTIDAVVQSTRFRNEETGFAIISLTAKDSTAFTALGVLSVLKPGDAVRIYGEFIENEQYGRQFKVRTFSYRMATTATEIESMLASGVIDEVGPKRAHDIVAYFGAETIAILDSSPHRLREVPGIGEKRAEIIIKSWQEQTAMRSLMLYLQPHGVPIGMIYRIFKTYGVRALEIVSANPYKLIEDIRGVGFKKADAIASGLGMAKDAPQRLMAALLHSLQEASGNGHCFLERETLLKDAGRLTEVASISIQAELTQMIKRGQVIAEEESIYLRLYHRLESELANIVGREGVEESAPLMAENLVREWALRQCEDRGIAVNEQQIQAVIQSQKSPFMILTGGPGTGKTTTLKLIIDLMDQNNQLIILAAPTGRAAQKMGEVTGHDSVTIHRLLEYSGAGSEGGFRRDAENPLDGDVFIIDEFSMVDLWLAACLFQAIPRGARIILVGDSDQLPSIGAGNVLGDFIQSKCIPVITLVDTFRNAGKIITAAHEMRRGVVPTFPNNSTENCFFLRSENPEDIARTVIELVSSRLPQKYEVDPLRDIQVLTAMHNGCIGTTAINSALQKTLNAGADTHITSGEQIFALGDKVMQTSNNYEMSVFNGDIGYVTGVSEKELVVQFGEIEAVYTKRDLEQLTLAYCISIHKSQGSEFPIVIIPIAKQQYIMLRRNLIYTALTRAKLLCVFVGSPSALAMAVRNKSDHTRNTSLSQRISNVQKTAVPNKKNVLEDIF